MGGSPTSSHNTTSEIPSDDLGSPPREDSTKWQYRWNLHFEDETFPPRKQRGLVHSFLNFVGSNDQDDQGGSATFGVVRNGSNQWQFPQGPGSDSGSDSRSRHNDKGHHHGREHC
ncbi:hypothetical protein D1007_35980 [Hordeum vulgare]|nr:hypothetical protein D1007_35980 [Hordeum vulgare]KAI5015036.1 hypothetical protein ZWY2020_056426 [Hordeum vulgare]